MPPQPEKYVCLSNIPERVLRHGPTRSWREVKDVVRCSIKDNTPPDPAEVQVPTDSNFALCRIKQPRHAREVYENLQGNTMARLQGKPYREEPLVAWLCDKHGDGPLEVIDGPRDPTTNDLILPSRDFVGSNFNILHTSHGTYAQIIMPQYHSDASRALPPMQSMPVARSPQLNMVNQVPRVCPVQAEGSRWRPRHRHHSSHGTMVRPNDYAQHQNYEPALITRQLDQVSTEHRQRPSSSTTMSSRPSSSAANPRQSNSSFTSHPGPFRRAQRCGMSGSSTRSSANHQAGNAGSQGSTSAKVIEAALENDQGKSCIKFRDHFSKNGAKELLDHLESRLHLGKHDFTFHQGKAEKGKTKVSIEILSRPLAKEVLRELHNSDVGGNKIDVVSDMTQNCSFDNGSQASSSAKTGKKTKSEPTICNGS